MPEETESKPASQALELFRFFQRVGRSFVGLVLLQIGWTFVLVLATKLTGEEHGPPAVGGLLLTHLWIYGGFVILLIWAIYSRLIAYVIWPFLSVLKIVLRILFSAVVIFAEIVDLVLLPIVRRVRKALIRRQLRADKATWIAGNLKINSTSGPAYLAAENQYECWLTTEREKMADQMPVDKNEWIKSYREQHPESNESDVEHAFNAWKVKAQREYGDRRLEDIAADKVFLTEHNFSNLAGYIRYMLLLDAEPGIVIGIAPLVKYPRGQELVFEEPPLQQFGAAIATTRAHLKHLKGINYIALRPLPSLFRIETESRARFAHALFQLDAVVWGRYTNDDERFAQVHIVTSARIRKIGEAERRISVRPERDFGFRRQQQIFPQYIDFDFLANASAFSFCPQNPIDAHIVMCVAMLHAVVRRTPEIFYFPWIKSYQTPGSDARRVLVHLAFDILPIVRSTDAPAQVLPTATAVVADVVSRWAGYQLEDSFPFRMAPEDQWIIDETELFVPQLHRVVSKCAELMPNVADHFYRLGAFSCMMRKQEQALDEFRHAGILDRNSGHLRRIPPIVLARRALKDAESSFDKKERALARFAAHAACAINVGDASDVQSMMEQSHVTVLDIAKSQAGDCDIEPVVAVVLKLLAEAEQTNPDTATQAYGAREPLVSRI